MFIFENEIHSVVHVPPGGAPDYERDNPVSRLMTAIEGVELSAERQHYLVDSVQYLLPFSSATLYGPSGDQSHVVDPRNQDNKNDFQKQNLQNFDLGSTQLTRGYATAGDWAGPFLHISYAPLLNSPLAAGSPYRGATVLLNLTVGKADAGPALLTVPYNELTHRYEIELWAHDGQGLAAALGPKGAAALARGELQARPDLVRGSLDDFQGPAFDKMRDDARDAGAALLMFDYVPDHTMHPIRSLRIQLNWKSESQDVWDSAADLKYRYEFGMVLRGWKNYMGVGSSNQPHGGLGSLEYRNLFSNYFDYENRRHQELGSDWLNELGRDLEPWNFDALDNKPPAVRREAFMPVNYMDLHLLKPCCAIGIHRHRDNLEAFFMMHGKGLMVTGDWCKFPQRDRAFEVRTMLPGDVVLIRGGQFHGLINSLDENVRLFMFGGYD